ncbi:unnamed protein product [Paramecium pentaurelia]|uniref:Uncharacterized protein n=1 Tax=Paramecium pentaurelia TaxID=43138 RepID=A0A8S1WNT3_9CILI|nr:unnamed protein product [Paramecium pentaurelia]
MSIYFDGSQVGLQIQPLQFDPSYTIENMYQYLQQCQIDTSQYGLSFDGQTTLNQQDNAYIGSLIQPNSGFLVILLPQPLFNIYFDGTQQILSQQLPNIPITDLLAYLQQNGTNFPQNIAIDYHDGNSQLIAQDVDTNQLLYTYTQGNQVLMLNIRQIQQNIQPKGSSNKVTSQKTNMGAQELLQSLILLKNLSLLIDPNGQFVVYKFHFPTLIQGYLEKSKGKDPENVLQFDWRNSDWQEKNNIKYCSFDDYGFAVAWDDGKISSVKIRQQ